MFMGRTRLRYIGPRHTSTMSAPEQISNVFPCENYPKNGRMYFTGPEGNRDQRVSVAPEHRVIGIGAQSKEYSSEADYLWRAPSNQPFPTSKSGAVGSIGWGIEQFTDRSMPLTGRQIVLGQFRQELENKYTHRYQGAWYPGPKDQIAPRSDAAMVMNTYKQK